MASGKGPLKKGMEVLDTEAPLSGLKGRTVTFEDDQSIYIGEIHNYSENSISALLDAN